MDKLKIKNVKLIESYELDKFIEKIYGKPYSFQQQAGCIERGIHNIEIIGEKYESSDDLPDTVKEEINGDDMCVSFESWLKTDPSEHKERNGWSDWEVKLFWARNFYPCLEDVMEDLCKKGHIKPGQYTINVDW